MSKHTDLVVYDVKLKTVHKNIEKFFEQNNITGDVRKKSIDVVNYKMKSVSHKNFAEEALLVSATDEKITDVALKSLAHVMELTDAQEKFNTLTQRGGRQAKYN